MRYFTSMVLLSFFVSSYAWKQFTVPHVDGEDDTQGLLSALANFSSNSTILFERGVSYNIFTPIKFPALENVEVAIEGNLTYPTDIATIQGTSDFTKPRIMFIDARKAIVGESVSNHCSYYICTIFEK